MADNTKSKTIILGVAAAAVLIASLSVGPSPKQPMADPYDPPSSPMATEISVQFLGQTNVTGERFDALLSITNRGADVAVVFPHAYLIKHGESWQTNTHIPPDVFIKGLGKLPPGESKTLIVPPPQTDATWKLLVIVVEKHGGLTGVIEKSKEALSELQLGDGKGAFHGGTHRVTSPEISPQN